MLVRLTVNDETLLLAGSGLSLEELTGFDGDFVLWIRGSDRRLYGPTVSEEERLWDGIESTEEKAARLGLTARAREDFEKDLSASLLSLREIRFPFMDAGFAAAVLRIVGQKRRFRKGDVVLRDLRESLGLLRARKSASEIEKMRAAARKSAEAHVALMKGAWVGKTERDVARLFDLELRRREIDRTAYETIVGSGERAMILHGRASDRVIRDGELILVDAGGFWDGYCADITRTMPSGKTFTAAQRKLYEIVLNAQKRAIASVKPGATLEAIHAQAREDLAEGLRRHGWLPDPALLGRWFPHNTSHWLGRQVHDPCPYRDENGQPILFEEGMVLTIEPGLYIRGDEAPAEIRGLGIRIEDDVVVTATGVEVLTSGAPKEIDDIEALRS